MKLPGQRTPAEWRHHDESLLGDWWSRWEKPLQRHDALLPTLAAGDNLAMFARQMGVGRSQWIARALVDADMWDRRVLVLSRPMMRLYWTQTLTQAGISAGRVETESVYRAALTNLHKQLLLMEAIERADVVIIEPAARPKTKQFAGLAKQLREAPSTVQFITTTTLVWGSQLAPPRYVDSCLKLLGYLDAPDDIKVCWAEDCWEAAA